MELKTKIQYEDDKQELNIIREFELPVELLYKAHTEPELIEQWMGNKVLKFEPHNHGGWVYETKNLDGIVVFRANGVFHEIVENERITRTFEMENTGFPIQLEFFEFSKISDDRSRLIMHIIYKSVEHRDQILKMPFAQGINMAHNRLEEILQSI
ncbi:SRPBCC domain-containing protein [Leptospira sp. 96542]|nr:SRPBCC domain-containing protein [Leptospira sp. 96542]